MKKHVFLMVLIASFSLGFWAMADENDVAQKTDGSFSSFNDPQASDSSFVGAASRNAIDNTFEGGNVEEQTDGTFVQGDNIQSEDTLFSGNTYHQQVSSSTDGVFAQDNEPPQKDDGSFAGEDTQKKTESSFDGQKFGN